MSQAPLDSAELEAIQAALREAAASTPRFAMRSMEDVTPLALIVDDRDAESARPTAMRIGARWVKDAAARLKGYLRDDVEIHVVGAEVMSGSSLRDELADMWLTSLRVSERVAPALLVIGGPVLGSVTAALCGAAPKDKDKVRSPERDDDDRRPPSPATIRIFQPAGDALAAILCDAWRDEQSAPVTRDGRPDVVEVARRSLCEADVVIALNVQIVGRTTGRMRLFARPSTLVRPPAPIEAVPAAPGALEVALGRVPVEIRVELGRTRLTIRELENLTVGTVITLPQFVDDPLAIECGGVIKAYGRPVVSRGVLAVQIERVFSQRGKRAA